MKAIFKMKFIIQYFFSDYSFIMFYNFIYLVFHFQFKSLSLKKYPYLIIKIFFNFIKFSVFFLTLITDFMPYKANSNLIKFLIII